MLICCEQFARCKKNAKSKTSFTRRDPIWRLPGSSEKWIEAEGLRSSLIQLYEDNADYMKTTLFVLSKPSVNSLLHHFDVAAMNCSGCSGVETLDIGCNRFSPDSLVVWTVASSQVNHAGLTTEQTSWEVSMLQCCPFFSMQFQLPTRFCTGMLIILLIRKGVRRWRCTSHLEQSFSGCLKGCSMNPADSLVTYRRLWSTYMTIVFIRSAKVASSKFCWLLNAVDHWDFREERAGSIEQQGRSAMVMRIDIIRSLRLSKGQGMLRWDKRIWAMGGFCRSQVIQLRCWQGLTRLIFIQYHTVFKTSLSKVQSACHLFWGCNWPF